MSQELPLAEHPYSRLKDSARPGITHAQKGFRVKGLGILSRKKWLGSNRLSRAVLVHKQCLTYWCFRGRGRVNIGTIISIYVGITYRDYDRDPFPQFSLKHQYEP